MEQYDVLVVGSGGAGQRAALEAARRDGLRVALITKIFPTRSASSHIRYSKRFRLFRRPRCYRILLSTLPRRRIRNGFHGNSFLSYRRRQNRTT